MHPLCPRLMLNRLLAADNSNYFVSTHSFFVSFGDSFNKCHISKKYVYWKRYDCKGIKKWNYPIYYTSDKGLKHGQSDKGEKPGILVGNCGISILMTKQDIFDCQVETFCLNIQIIKGKFDEISRRFPQFGVVYWVSFSSVLSEKGSLWPDMELSRV